jgi:hypothetical protein
MAKVQISRSDIDGLGAKLAALEPLTEAERALLQLMLSLAADSIDAGQRASTQVSAARDQSAPVVVEMMDSVPSIDEEFARAFTPGAAEGFHRVTASVGVGEPPPREVPEA